MQFHMLLPKFSRNVRTSPIHYVSVYLVGTLDDRAIRSRLAAFCSAALDRGLVDSIGGVCQFAERDRSLFDTRAERQISMRVINRHLMKRTTKPNCLFAAVFPGQLGEERVPVQQLVVYNFDECAPLNRRVCFCYSLLSLKQD